MKPIGKLRRRSPLATTSAVALLKLARKPSYSAISQKQEAGWCFLMFQRGVVPMGAVVGTDGAREILVLGSHLLDEERAE